MKQQTIQISEFGLIFNGKKSDDEYTSKYLCDSINCSDQYNELEEFVKSDAGQQIFEFVKNGKCLRAKNYVGTLQFKSGLTIEILPKIAKSQKNENRQKSQNDAKVLLVKLLCILYKLPNYKHIDKANFNYLKHMRIFEIFINMFLGDIGRIIKHGLKSDYTYLQENQYFLKGKLLFNENLRLNLAHKERFFMEFSDYNQNCPENRLLKSTLNFLYQASNDWNNKRLILQYLEHMGHIKYSSNFIADFRSIKKERGLRHYENALIWSKIFLNHSSFDIFCGNSVAFAILFPMQTLFESFVGWYLRKSKPNLEILEQFNSRNFVKGLFGISPDFVAKNGKDIEFIADAKWKVISKNNDFSQSDFYQLFTYHKLFKSPNTHIYYPQSDEKNCYKFFEYFDGNKIEIYFLDILKELGN
ncbi:hypothetical protein KDE13_05520 [Campylobacter sp. faydin G-140]|uniref:McrC family protein n=1 Tax=Campylobacter anatolicus TaxID=2829105 RepID=UPI001B93E93E|nr:hypothetical protein [Campylobacter anatolicus]MBR8465811.1 hypothetical protein [Campylobacter anatolicus]